MKKKLLSLLMICVLALSSFSVVSAAEAAQAADKGEYDHIASMAGTEAIAQIGSKTEKTIFLDLRSALDYNLGHIKGTVSAPVCLPEAENYAVPLANQEAFIAQMNALNIDSYDKIYLHCYMGTFCVDYAAEWLVDIMNISDTKLVRVLGGTFQDPALAAASNNRTPSYTFADSNRIIIDVRANEVQDAAYLPEAIHQPLFRYVNGSSTLNDNQAQQDAFVKFANANEALLKSKTVYILCNSGSKGAEQATKLLTTKCNITNVYTIEGGAGALKNIDGMLFPTNTVNGTDAVASIDNAAANAVILDVRTKANYEKGHLKGALNIPVFGANGASNGYDDMAKSFLAGLEANAAKLANKNIYIVCNSGQSGARIATKLLNRAGYANENIFTIVGGNKGVAEDMSVPNNSFYVSAEYALKTEGIILDVRANETVESTGLIAGSIHQPIFAFNKETNTPDINNNAEQVAAFITFVAENKTNFEGKNIFILCNSGSRGAAKATELLADVKANIYTIDGGAKNDLPFVKDETPETPEQPEVPETPEQPETPEKPSSPVTGETFSMGYVLIMLAAVLAFVSKKRFA